MKKLFTSESVTSGHPDKLCDILSDAILDAYMQKDKDSRVACEICANYEKVIVMGEITSKGHVDIPKIVREKIIQIGYNSDITGYNGYKIPIEVIINEQSPDISMGVNKKDLGAGDQGMMFGYATNETKTYMPYSVYYANLLSRRLEFVRQEKIIPYLLPDGKSQVTVILENDQLVGIDTIVISSQHQEVDINLLRKDIKKEVIDKVIPSKLRKNAQIFINPTGRFVIGGPLGDSGLTGRKIIVDTYGGVAPHGGGAFSGKDYTKVDRTAAYYARYVCKNIVASGLCQKMSLQVSYAIGVSKPLAIYINTYNTNIVSEEQIYYVVNKVFDFRPAKMIKELDMKNLVYSKTTCYGHFGKKGLSYEKLDKVPIIKELLHN